MPSKTNVSGLYPSLSQRPLISVITVCKNSEMQLESCIRSVLSQTFQDYEFIVIDGASTDGTVDIIRKFEAGVDHWVSEPDHGIGEAFNKGLGYASGIYVHFLGADDYFENEQVLAQVAVRLEGGQPWIGYGKVNVRDAGGDLLYTQGEAFDAEKFKERNRIPHQACFVKQDYFQKYGLFDPSLRIGMDYEHFLRGIFHVPVEFFDVTVSNFTTGGTSDSYGRVTERLVIHRRHGIHGPFRRYVLFFLSSIRWSINYLLSRTPIYKIVLKLSFYPTKRRSAEGLGD